MRVSHWIGFATLVCSLTVLLSCDSHSSVADGSKSEAGSVLHISDVINDGLLRIEDLPDGTILSRRLVGPVIPSESCTGTADGTGQVAFTLPPSENLAETISAWPDGPCVIQLIRRVFDNMVVTPDDPRQPQSCS